METSGELFGRPKYSLTVNTGVDCAFVFLLAMIMEKRDAEWSRHLDGGGGRGVHLGGHGGGHDGGADGGGSGGGCGGGCGGG